jgi:hypothetical protein
VGRSQNIGWSGYDARIARRRSIYRRFRSNCLRLWRGYRTSALWLQLGCGIVALAFGWFIVNGLYQIVRKPTELLFPVSGTLDKTPAETWRQYGPAFRANATPVMAAELLAAIAQVEASGNPIARTYWRWAWTLHPLQIYRPASSAVGMYQLTDSTFAEARHLCIRHHQVVTQGAWNDWHGCWFNALYFRVLPAQATELTSAYLDRAVTVILARHHIANASLPHQQALAAVIHLCGAGAGDLYARGGFRLRDDQYCGDQLARSYVARVETMKATFERIAARDSGFLD